jgi:hypothetical protein
MVAALPIDHQSIVRAAEEMISDYGSEAWATSKQRAQDLRREGFESVAVAWDRISEAIEEKHGQFEPNSPHAKAPHPKSSFLVQSADSPSIPSSQDDFALKRIKNNSNRRAPSAHRSHYFDFRRDT